MTLKMDPSGLGQLLKVSPKADPKTGPKMVPKTDPLNRLLRLPKSVS